jgi:hypothetical protein
LCGYLQKQVVEYNSIIIKGANLDIKFGLEVYNPSGTTEVSNVHAPRLNTLKGMTICELSDGIWQHDRTFIKLRDSLHKKLPETKIVPYTEFPIGDEIDVDGIEEVVKRKGCNGVIIGNAA